MARVRREARQAPPAKTEKLADALYHGAEATIPPWEPVLVNDAIVAAERLRARFPDDMPTAAALGWLQLARDNPEQALREVGPLLTPEVEPDLTVSHALVQALRARFGGAGQ